MRSTTIVNRPSHDCTVHQGQGAACRRKRGAAGENVPSAGFPIDLNHGGLPIYVQGRITEGGKIAAKQRQYVEGIFGSTVGRTANPNPRITGLSVVRHRLGRWASGPAGDPRLIVLAEAPIRREPRLDRPRALHCQQQASNPDYPFEHGAVYSKA